MQPRRMNVSLTRARELLVIVGNTVALSTDPDWRAYIAFCRRNGVYEGVEPPVGAIAEDTSHVSYMEEAFHHARIDGKGDEEELTSRILVGAMASAVLRDA